MARAAAAYPPPALRSVALSGSPFPTIIRHFSFLGRSHGTRLAQPFWTTYFLHVTTRLLAAERFKAFALCSQISLIRTHVMCNCGLNVLAKVPVHPAPIAHQVLAARLSRSRSLPIKRLVRTIFLFYTHKNQIGKISCAQTLDAPAATPGRQPPAILTLKHGQHDVFLAYRAVADCSARKHGHRAKEIPVGLRIRCNRRIHCNCAEAPFFFIWCID